MWLRLTEINSGDFMVNMDQVRFIQPTADGCTLYFGGDLSDESDHLQVSQPIDFIEEMIFNSSPQNVVSVAGQATPTSGP